MPLRRFVASSFVPGRRRAAIAALCAGIVLSIGLAVAYGWIGHVATLIQLHPDWATMKFNTALCFVVLSAGILLQLREHTIGARCGAMAVIAVACATLLQDALAVDLRIDNALVVPFLQQPGVAPGRMSPVTAALFAMSGTALALISWPQGSWRSRIVGLIASIVGGVALAAVIGYATRTPAAYGWGAVTSVAFHTAVSFLLLAVALTALAAHAAEAPIPRWLPAAALIGGLACTLALGRALFYELSTRQTLVPEVVIAVGIVASLLMASSLRARERLAQQRDSLAAAVRRRDQALRERDSTEQLLRGVLETAPDAMLITDADGRIVLVNDMTELLFGFPRRELIGELIERVVPERMRADHEKLRSKFALQSARRMMGEDRELTGMRRDGSEFPIDVALSALQLPDRRLYVSVVRDITSRRQAEERLRESLRDKELLLKEIHHRVKNNLQVVASMLSLQSEISGDAEVITILDECRQRVISMSMVHEKLYGTGDLRHLDLGELLRGLVTMLLSNRVGAAIELGLELDSVQVDVEKAFPVSLIVNELVTNVLKHAFRERTRGRLLLSVRRSADMVTVSVADDGIGGVTEATFTGVATLGATIVRNLVRQLDGRLQVSSAPGAGTDISVTFSVSA